MRTHESPVAKGELAVPPVVNGCLLVLCVLLPFVYPASSLYAIFWQVMPKLVNAHSPSAMLRYGVYSALFAALAVLSFIAGLKLWLVRPEAVKFARRYLLVYLASNIAYLCFGC